MAKLVKIYALSDPRLPRTWENVRYVGKTHCELRVRLSGHVCRKNNAHKSQWVRSIEAAGLLPAIWPLAFCSYENWQEEEIFWIKKLRQIASLTNILDGGGNDIVWTDELRALLSNKCKHRKKRVFSEMHKERIRLAAIGRKASPESIAKRVAATKGKKRSPEICEKFRLIQLARGPRGPHSEEAKRKIAASHIGMGVSLEARKKIGAANSVPLRCVETGEIFSSAVEAAKKFGVSSTTIKRSSNRGVSLWGMHFVKVSQCHAQP